MGKGGGQPTIYLVKKVLIMKLPARKFQLAQHY